MNLYKVNVIMNKGIPEVGTIGAGFRDFLYVGEDYMVWT